MFSVSGAGAARFVFSSAFPASEDSSPTAPAIDPFPVPVSISNSIPIPIPFPISIPLSVPFPVTITVTVAVPIWPIASVIVPLSISFSLSFILRAPRANVIIVPHFVCPPVPLSIPVTVLVSVPSCAEAIREVAVHVRETGRGGVGLRNLVLL